MQRRLAAVFTVFAMLAALVAPAHPPATASLLARAGADLCTAGVDRGPGPVAPAGDRRHPCERCDGCVGGGAALPPAAAAAQWTFRPATESAPESADARPQAAPAAPLARGPPARG